MRALLQVSARRLGPLSGIALGLVLALAPSAAAAAPPTVNTAARCYAVGKAVSVSGTGFTASAEYDLTVDGVDFGQSETTSSGTLSASFSPGGLAAGQAQIVDTLDVSDGISDVHTTFTVTRETGALVGAGTGTSPQRKVPFEVWDFAPTGPRVPVYLHYVRPHGGAARTVALGTAGGQCGYLRTKPLALFPFGPSTGKWTLQFDTHRAYSAHPAGRVARLAVDIG
jgi:hypothetical protein